jgi:hypothetical protein
MDRKPLIVVSLLTFMPCFVVTAVSAAHPHPIRQAHADRGARWYNSNYSWHGPYSHVQWGRPLALIVPPTANMQTEYGWGVARTQMVPIHHQFDRPVALPGSRGGWSPTPPWPWSTTQMGVYSVRGPW